MQTIAEYEIRLPLWSLCSLVNGDNSGLDSEDIKQIENFETKCLHWVKQNEASHFALHLPDYIDREKYFYPFPEFGLACDVIDTKIVIFK